MFEIQETTAPITNVITQLWFQHIKTVQFASIPPSLFWDTNQSQIVAVWHIKGTKQLNNSPINMLTIDEIIANKINGIDCTEEESAEIKGYLKELNHLFPLEFSETAIN